eukprot:15352773-Ditylum_brightwellii.AAC.1
MDPMSNQHPHLGYGLPQKSLLRYNFVNGNSTTKKCLSNDQLVFGVINPAYSGKQHTYVYVTIGALQEKVDIEIERRAKLSDKMEGR